MDMSVRPFFVCKVLNNKGAQRIDANGGEDHCVDDILQVLMCHVDTSAVTFDWKGPKNRRPWPNFNVDHTYMDWEAIDLRLLGCGALVLTVRLEIAGASSAW